MRRTTTITLAIMGGSLLTAGTIVSLGRHRDDPACQATPRPADAKCDRSGGGSHGSSIGGTHAAATGNIGGGATGGGGGRSAGESAGSARGGFGGTGAGHAGGGE